MSTTPPAAAGPYLVRSDFEEQAFFSVPSEANPGVSGGGEREEAHRRIEAEDPANQPGGVGGPKTRGWLREPAGVA
jgi:hypothetical protein